MKFWIALGIMAVIAIVGLAGIGSHFDAQVEVVDEEYEP